MDLSIIIPSYNTKDLITSCVKSIIKHTSGLKYEIIVVDNASTDKSVEALKKQKKVNLIENNKNLGFAGANNIGYKESKGEYILFLNSDTLLRNNLLKEMIDWMKKNPGVGAASCTLKNSDGSLQATGGYFPTLPRVIAWMFFLDDIPGVNMFIKSFHPMGNKSPIKNISFYKKEREIDWLTGAFMLTRKDVLDKLKGPWDESYFMYTEDVDICYRIKRSGHKIMYLPRWDITHLGGASGTKESTILSEFRGVKRFYSKFYPKWQYLILRFLLKTGSLGRIIIFGILEGLNSAKIYAKAFKKI